MATSRAPLSRNDCSWSRNCAMCSRQKIHPWWRRKALTAGSAAQSEPSLTGRPSESGNTIPASFSLIYRGTTSFSSDSPGLSSKATQCSLAANRKSPELAVAIRIKSERCAPRRSARKNLCSKRMKAGFSQYLVSVRAPSLLALGIALILALRIRARSCH
jgi:hypothetical protein